jgi:thiamine pyrophosphate-dependent acetolactate synthase large subunit-like protein
MAQTVADQMVEVLAAAGVKRVYGVVGDSLNGFTDAIRRRGGSNGSTCATKRSPPSPPAPTPM